MKTNTGPAENLLININKKVPENLQHRFRKKNPNFLIKEQHLHIHEWCYIRNYENIRFHNPIYNNLKHLERYEIIDNFIKYIQGVPIFSQNPNRNFTFESYISNFIGKSANFYLS